MLFTKDSAAGLADGTITLTFRTWSRPQAKVGGRYRTWGLLLEVDDVRSVDPGSITNTEARRAGYPSPEALVRRLEQQGHDGAVWRVEFHCVGADDRIARRNDTTLDPERLAKLRARLDRLDRASSSGPWTARTLQLIAAKPGVVSSILARQLKMERPAFKINVRKLKELGLTESLEVGYRLSALGEAFLKVAENTEK
jgi:hypothetical protein